MKLLPALRETFPWSRSMEQMVLAIQCENSVPWLSDQTKVSVRQEKKYHFKL